ncbi:MAG: hypothetical protein WD875_05465 [Pirellulales bacterium]
MRSHLIRAACVVAVAAVSAIASAPAQATIRDTIAHKYAMQFPWHGPYNHPVYRQPLALVVPPTAGNTSEYGWGVGSYRITPIYHQFGRHHPGYPVQGGAYLTPPPWPSDTTQFGVHYIRGPW